MAMVVISLVMEISMWVSIWRVDLRVLGSISGRMGPPIPVTSKME